MLHDFQFDLINQLCQSFKNSIRPFGGMQIVCSGDLFQLPPVQKGGKAKFITESKIWKSMDLKICYLKEQHRQESGELLTLLNYIRNNMASKAREILINGNRKEGAFSVALTKLYTHNIDVDAINNFELSKIKEKEFVYYMNSRGQENISSFLAQSCLAPEKLALKKGAKVMFVKNNFDKGYVNGTLGEVVNFNEDGLPIVKTFMGNYITAESANWTIEEDEEVKAEVSQIPLRLAYAITVHKSQGMNLDAAEIDLSKSFVRGMGYVALSRLRNLLGLKLVGINEIAFLVDEDILRLDKIFKKASEEMIKNLKDMSFQAKQKRQREFLGFLPQIGQKRRKDERKTKIVESVKKTEEIRPKKHNYQICGRMIRQRGNCLPCNIAKKNKRKA